MTDGSSIQDDFLQIIKDSGLQDIAESSGVVGNDAPLDLSGTADNGFPVVPTPTKGGKRAMTRDDDESEGDDDLQSPPSKKRKARQRGNVGDKNKGLRHFSMRVCEKVREKGRTTYNEVADELVAELVNTPENLAAMRANPPEASYDEKNIRRRVYDALNVLMAMDILAKEKKEIIWRGLPQNTTQDLEDLSNKKAARHERLEWKKKHIEELSQQLAGYRALMARNRRLVESEPAYLLENENRVNLPFIIVNTNRDTQIVCEMTETREEIFFNFDNPFEIHDDNEILSRMVKSQALPVSPAPSNRGIMQRGRLNGKGY